MDRQCAWCGAHIGTKETGDAPARAVTHGICRPCAARILAEPMESFLERLEFPVVVLDRELTVRAMNSRALVTIEKPLADIKGRKWGEVIECLDSQKPGGCGNQICCVGCSVRKAVRETASTGRGIANLPSTHDPSSPGHSPEFEISTENSNGVVFVRINRLKSPAAPPRP